MVMMRRRNRLKVGQWQHDGDDDDDDDQHDDETDLVFMRMN